MCRQEKFSHFSAQNEKAVPKTAARHISAGVSSGHFKKSAGRNECAIDRAGSGNSPGQMAPLRKQFGMNANSSSHFARWMWTAGSDRSFLMSAARAFTGGKISTLSRSRFVTILRKAAKSCICAIRYGCLASGLYFLTYHIAAASLRIAFYQSLRT